MARLKAKERKQAIGDIVTKFVSDMDNTSQIQFYPGTTCSHQNSIQCHIDLNVPFNLDGFNQAAAKFKEMFNLGEFSFSAKQTDGEFTFVNYFIRDLIEHEYFNHINIRKHNDGGKLWFCNITFWTPDRIK